jgi:hypothetical protein
MRPIRTLPSCPFSCPLLICPCAMQRGRDALDCIAQLFSWVLGKPVSGDEAACCFPVSIKNEMLAVPVLDGEAVAALGEAAHVNHEQTCHW